MLDIPMRGRKVRFSRYLAVRLGLLAVIGLLSGISLVMPFALRQTSFSLEPGDVAPQDIRAPRSAAYESQILTEQARQEAANTVGPVYLTADPSIARRQIERLQVSLDYITNVRSDLYASFEQKMADLQNLTDIRITQETAEKILALNDNRWEILTQETERILEQVMRSTIRGDRLEDARRSIPALVSFSLTQDQASIVTELASAFVAANSLYSPDQTQAARESIRAQVKPVQRTYAAGETIVSNGQIITPAIHEALDYFGLVQAKDHNQEFIAAAAIVLLSCAFLGLYFQRRKPPVLDDIRGLLMISGFFLIFLFGARFIIPNRTVLPYIYPLPAFALTIAALYNVELGLVLSLVLSVLSGYGLSNSLDLTLFYILSSFCGTLVLGRANRIANFFWSGIAIGAAGTAVIFAYRLSESISDWFGLATLSGSAFLNGLASASLALLIQFLFSQVLGLTTALQLLDISRPDHPLLQFILRNAPGSYQHSLQVANLAEQAAEEIGADGLLTRVGAIYHDAGKALNPLFFIENQVPGSLDTHDEMDPNLTAAIIIQHVADGLTLARKYHLPPRIQAFIREHHGNMVTRYQYAKAMELAGGDSLVVDIHKYQYPGPRPQSREAALLMLADNCEARARSKLPKDEDELYELIKAVFDRCRDEGQLDDTRITMKDLTIAMQSFAATLRGIYHPRVPYPELKPDTSSTVQVELHGQPQLEVSNEPALPPLGPK